MADLLHNKWLRRASGSYKILNVQRHTVTPEENSILNAYFIDSSTLSPTRAQVTDHVHKTHQIKRSQHENQIERYAVKDGENETKCDTTVMQKYVECGIMGCGDTSQGRRYVIKWYRYGPGDDTLELLYHIPTHFIRQRWNHLPSRRQIPGHNETPVHPSNWGSYTDQEEDKMETRHFQKHCQCQNTK